MRGCACRGDSAGFVHLECLTELASKTSQAFGDAQPAPGAQQDSSDSNVVVDAWTHCNLCKSPFVGALEGEMKRRFWWRYRAGQNQRTRDQLVCFVSIKCVAQYLGFHREIDTANHLYDAEASKFVGLHPSMFRDLELARAEMLKKSGQKLEALERLQGILPEARADTANPTLCNCIMLATAASLLDVGRYQEAHEMATELVAFAKANFAPDTSINLVARPVYARACAMLGRMEESKSIFEDLLATETRVYGRDHPNTQEIRKWMQRFGFAVPTL